MIKSFSKKYKTTLKCDPDYLFDYMTSDLRKTYSENKKSKEEPIHKGLIFNCDVKVKKITKTATVKVLEYDKPAKFAMEYRSNEYHKITAINTRRLDDKRIELIYEIHEERITDGKTTLTPEVLNSGEAKNAPLKDKIQYNRVASFLREQKRKGIEIK